MAAICAHCPNQIAAANIFPHYALYNGRKYEQSTAYCLSTSNALPLQNGLHFVHTGHLF